MSATSTHTSPTTTTTSTSTDATRRLDPDRTASVTPPGRGWAFTGVAAGIAGVSPLGAAVLADDRTAVDWVRAEVFFER